MENEIKGKNGEKKDNNESFYCPDMNLGCPFCVAEEDIVGNVCELFRKTGCTPEEACSLWQMYH